MAHTGHLWESAGVLEDDGPYDVGSLGQLHWDNRVYRALPVGPLEPDYATPKSSGASSPTYLARNTYIVSIYLSIYIFHAT